jgi:hypothetical protein
VIEPVPSASSSVASSTCKPNVTSDTESRAVNQRPNPTIEITETNSPKKVDSNITKQVKNTFFLYLNKSVFNSFFQKKNFVKFSL